MLQVLSIDVYALYDLGATFSFVTSFVDMLFEILPDVLEETQVWHEETTHKPSSIWNS